MTSPATKRLLAVLAATAAAALTAAAAEALLGHPLRVGDGSGEELDVGVPAVAVLSAAAGFLGWGSLVVLERLTRRAVAVWTVVAALVLMLSFLPIIGSDASGATRLILVALHVIVAVVLIPAFRRTAALQDRAPTG